MTSGDTGPYFAALSQELMRDSDIASTHHRISRGALDVLRTADFAALTVRRRRGRLETEAPTDELARRCDELQYELGEGPCMESALEDESFVVHSTRTDERWPRWGPAVAELGVHSMVSVQLPATSLDPDRDPLGAINIYSRRVGAFGDADRVRARVYAIHAANALTVALQVTTLTEAVEARHQIGLAQGVLVRRYGIDADQAFDLLHRYSNHANVKLRDVAATVLAEGELPTNYDDLSRS